jgi:hypothetical protein
MATELNNGHLLGLAVSRTVMRNTDTFRIYEYDLYGACPCSWSLGSGLIMNHISPHHSIQFL